MKKVFSYLLLLFILYYLIGCNTTNTSETKYFISGKVIVNSLKVEPNGKEIDTIRFNYSVDNLKLYLFEYIDGKDILKDSTLTSKGTFIFKNIINNSAYKIFAKICDDFSVKIAEKYIQNPISDTIFINDCNLNDVRQSERGALKVYPNPFNNYCNIEYYFSDSSQIRIDLNNISGDLINNIVELDLLPGTYMYMANIYIESGIYFLILKTNKSRLFNIIYKPNV
jgi:hypothetical protein